VFTSLRVVYAVGETISNQNYGIIILDKCREFNDHENVEKACRKAFFFNNLWKKRKSKATANAASKSDRNWFAT